MSFAVLICPSCKKNTIQTDTNAGELLCSSCGFVFEEKMQELRGEWRSSFDDVDRSRVGSRTSLTIHDMGLSTIIGIMDREGSGKPLSSSMKTMLSRLRVWDLRSRAGSSAERNLRQALNELIKAKGKLALTESIIENAAYLYRKAMEKNLVRGRSVYGIMGACIYAACRNTDTPRTLDDIATSLNIKRKHVAKYYRIIHNELSLQVPVSDPINNLSRITSAINASEKTRRTAIEIITKARECGIIAGKDPMGIAAAALYLASLHVGENCTQKEISDASGISQVTIRQRCLKLRELRN